MKLFTKIFKIELFENKYIYIYIYIYIDTHIIIYLQV